VGIEKHGEEKRYGVRGLCTRVYVVVLGVVLPADTFTVRYGSEYRQDDGRKMCQD
jgi:hypothetical protein